jgi:hypothetical protein
MIDFRNCVTASSVPEVAPYPGGLAPCGIPAVSGNKPILRRNGGAQQVLIRVPLNTAPTTKPHADNSDIRQIVEIHNPGEGNGPGFSGNGPGFSGNGPGLNDSRFMWSLQGFPGVLA